MSVPFKPYKRRPNRGGKRALRVEDPGSDLGESWLTAGAWSGSPGRRGVIVDHAAAMTLSAVYCAYRVFSDAIGSLPIDLMQRRDNGGARVATERPEYFVLKHRADKRIAAGTWRRNQQYHISSRGNGYSQILRNKRRVMLGLQPLHPAQVMPYWSINGKFGYGNISQPPLPGEDLWYRVLHRDGSFVTLPADEVLHLRGPITENGILGIDPITYARTSLSVPLEAQRYARNFLVNDARPGVVLKSPKRLNKEQRAELRENWSDIHSGTARAGSVAILTGGLELQPYSITPDNAQFLQTRQWSITEIARWFKIPPHKLMDMQAANDRNIESQNLGFLVDSLGPIICLWEEQLELSLLSEQDIRDGYFVRINPMGFLRSDSASRTAFYNAGRQWGWLSADDIRTLEDMDPLPNGIGQIYLSPTNMQDASKPMAAPTAPIDPKSLPGDGPDVSNITQLNARAMLSKIAEVIQIAA